MNGGGVIGVDPASGAKGGDAFAAAFATLEEDGIAVLQATRVWQPAFNPTAVVAECADWARGCGCTAVVGDRYAGGFVRELFERAGIEYQLTDRDKSQFFLALLPLVNAGRVRLLDSPQLVRELRGLERRLGREGRDRVDHQRGSHDDLANAAAIALVLASEGARRRGDLGITFASDGDDPTSERNPNDRPVVYTRGGIPIAEEEIGTPIVVDALKPRVSPWRPDRLNVFRSRDARWGKPAEGAF